MCFIFSCFTKDPLKYQLERAAESNRDGIGVAWVEEGKCKFIKGVELGKLIDTLPQIPFPHVIHFRVATVGGDKKELIHPFPVSPNQSSKLEWTGKCPLLFHNGTWQGWKHSVRESVYGGAKMPDHSQAWSDSKALAWMAGVHGIGVLDLIDFEPGRVCILYPDGRPALHYGEWSKNDGFWGSRPLADLFPAHKKHGSNDYTRAISSGFHGNDRESSWPGDTSENRSRASHAVTDLKGVSKGESTFCFCPDCDETLTVRASSSSVTCGVCHYTGTIKGAEEARKAKALARLNEANKTLPALVLDGGPATVEELRMVHRSLQAALRTMQQKEAN